VEILLVGLVCVNAEDHIPPADEFELGRTVVEACDLKYITYPVPVKTWAKKKTKLRVLDFALLFKEVHRK
jgi:hypothetical protein